MPPGAQPDSFFGRNAQARRTHQHQPRHPRRELRRDKTSHHAAKGKAHQIAHATAQQNVQALLDQSGQRVGVGAMQRRR